jgi:hypothetical protein
VNEPLCPSTLAIDPIAALIYCLLAVGTMIVIVTLIWRRYPPTCQQKLLAPSVFLLLALFFLAPVEQLIEWYILSNVGIEAQAVVVEQHIIQNSRELHRHRSGFIYHIPGPDGAACAIIKRNERVDARVYTRYPVGAAIPIRYLAYNPAVAHTESAKQVAWDDVFLFGLVMLVSTVVGFSKAYKWV